eukprot:472701-Amphidinium_carterae.1
MVLTCGRPGRGDVYASARTTSSSNSTHFVLRHIICCDHVRIYDWFSAPQHHPQMQQSKK